MIRNVFFKAFVWGILMLFLPVQLWSQSGMQSREYTEENPLIYEDAWDLWPYCYLNEHGEPEGYTVELVRMLCEQMNIPCEIRLKPTSVALKDLQEGRSDLMLGLDNRYSSVGLKSSKAVVQLFTHSVVAPAGQRDIVRKVDDLEHMPVIVHKGSFCHALMEQKGWLDNAQVQNDMKAAIKRLSAEGKGQIVWNTMSLKWLLRKYQITNLQITSVDMPHGAYKFMSRDTVLLNRLDKAYKVLNMSHHKIEQLQNRWFYPERVESGIPSWVWYVAGVAVFLALVLFALNVFYHKMERRMTLLIRKNTNRLSYILELSQITIWTYDVNTHTYALLTANGSYHQLSPMDLRNHFGNTDFERLYRRLKLVAEGRQAQATVELQAIPFSESSASGEKRDYMVQLSVLRKEGNRPAVLLGTMSDVSDEHKRRAASKELLMRYKSIFETAMVDMIYYNSKGDLANLNKRAMRTFGMDLEMAAELHINLKDVIGEDLFDPQTFDIYHVTRSMNVFNQFLPDTTVGTNRIFYELQLVPVRDANHRLLGVYGTGRDVTGFVKSWRHQKENIRKLRQANLEMEAYIYNIDYVLKLSGVRIVRYSPNSHTLAVYGSITEVEYVLTQSRCMSLVDDSSKKRSLRLLDSMDCRTVSPIEAVVLTNLRSNGRKAYLQICLVPMFDAQGAVTDYFGVCRDLTDMMTTEKELAKERKRAQEIEELKNSFLRNMSYEIRTPLNNVVGFAEQFEMDHQTDDEELFIAQIKDNSAFLLRLINDILFLSRLDAHMIEINPQPVDIAKTFESYCVAGWIHDQHKGVRYSVLNHFEQLVVVVDEQNLGLIINQVVANAAQHTVGGTVRARFDYFDGKLMIAVEDTGCGISEEDLAHVFERFNSNGSAGTGLGLPICRELTLQMGGNIDIDSRKGIGTTVWIVIPCELVSMERKMENSLT